MTVECTCENQKMINTSVHLADKSFFSNVKRVLEAIIEKWKTHRVLAQKKAKSSAALASLSKLDERSLKDIGISRADLTWASNLPNNVSASEALNQLRAHNIARTRHRIMHKEIKRK